MGANLRGFRTPGWKRTIPACPKVTEPAGMSPLWSRGTRWDPVDAVRGVAGTGRPPQEKPKAVPAGMVCERGKSQQGREWRGGELRGARAWPLSGAQNL